MPLRQPSRSPLARLLAQLLVRLLIIGTWPAELQVKAALFPVSILWPLVRADQGLGAVDPESPTPFGLAKDAFGKTITYSHDLSARQEVVTDRNGAVRVLDYDTRGNVVKETQL
jgi:hypothetical protein